MNVKEARLIVQLATVRGELPKANSRECEKCGAPAEERHHEDYTNPLEVNYLCGSCHRERHRERGDKRLYYYLCDRPAPPVSGKNKKLFVRVGCSSRSFYLSAPPKGGKAWQIRFTPPRSVREKLDIRERIIKSTGIEYSNSTIDAAKHVARRIIESYWDPNAIAAKEERRAATLGKVVELYRNGARSIEDKEELDQETINKNVSSVRRVFGTRFDEKGRERRVPWENITLDRLADLMTEFKRGWLRAVEGSDLHALSSAKHTVNSYIRQARSLFATEYLPLYRDLALPDLTELRNVTLFKNPGSTRYVPIPQSVIDAMDAEIRSLRRERPDLYLAFYFMLWLGMRVDEVCNARLEWIEEWPTMDGKTITRLAIVRRAYFRPKGIEGAPTIAPSLLADIRELTAAKYPMDFLIPSTNIRGRTIRDLSAIVRKHVGDERRKTCHELRKHAISMQLMRHRNYIDTLKFSRHSDVRTLQNHYEGYLDNLPPITNSDWRVA